MGGGAGTFGYCRQDGKIDGQLPCNSVSKFISKRCLPKTKLIWSRLGRANRLEMGAPLTPQFTQIAVRLL